LGAVLNSAFDYVKYLDILHDNGTNLARVIDGSYVESIDTSMFPGGEFRELKLEGSVSGAGKVGPYHAKKENRPRARFGWKIAYVLGDEWLASRAPGVAFSAAPPECLAPPSWVKPESIAGLAEIPSFLLGIRRRSRNAAGSGDDSSAGAGHCRRALSA
jgi:hypothetical protein